MRKLLLALVVLSLGACASMRKQEPLLSVDDVGFLSGEVAAYVGTFVPAASSRLKVGARTADPETAQLVVAVPQALRGAGFAVVEADALPATTGNLRAVSYSLVVDSGGVLVQCDIDGALGSRWYVRDPAGVLSAASGTTMRINQ